MPRQTIAVRPLDGVLRARDTTAAAAVAAFVHGQPHSDSLWVALSAIEDALEAIDPCAFADGYPDWVRRDAASMLEHEMGAVATCADCTASASSGGRAAA